MRWGLVSTARINDAVIGGAAESDAVEIVAVASRDGARARAYAREKGIAVAVDWSVLPRSEWETTLSDGARVEVVTAVQGG